MRTYLALFALLIVSAATTAQQLPAAADSFNLDDGVAIEGYDPVAYFTEDRAVKGEERYAAEHEGVTYFFATAANREIFLDDPERYVPAYGGWCGWAVSRGSLAGINPEAFVIHDGVLYLNFSQSINRRFQRSLEESIERAEANWPDLAREAASR
jgi:YHS domain-containing protein